jgi:hypothetical protein
MKSEKMLQAQKIYQTREKCSLQKTKERMNSQFCTSTHSQFCNSLRSSSPTIHIIKLENCSLQHTKEKCINKFAHQHIHNFAAA